jgi:hypothetical protein
VADDITNLGSLARLVDELEAHATGPLTLPVVRQAFGDEQVVARALDEEILLVDYRERLDAATGALLPVTLCRLNRRHPLVQALAAD